MPEPHPLVGRWRITWMDGFDPADFDAEEPAFIEFDAVGRGELHFCYVWGRIDYEVIHTSPPELEWTWEGNDEMDEAHGRGVARLAKDGTIKGKIVQRGGDKSAFRGERMETE